MCCVYSTELQHMTNWCLTSAASLLLMVAVMVVVICIVISVCAVDSLLFFVRCIH